MRLSEVPKLPTPEWVKNLSEKELNKINEILFKGLEKCE